MARTLNTDGTPTEIENPTRDDFFKRRREVGTQIGDLEGANIISAYIAYLFTENLSAELWGSAHFGGFFGRLDGEH